MVDLGLLRPNSCVFLKAIIDEINDRTHNKLTPTIVNILKKAKAGSDTVVIVTNARSDRWLCVLRSLFPDVVQLLEEENIPIIRSCPIGEEPDFDAPDYFSYWMNAKVRQMFAPWELKIKGIWCI